MTELQYPGGQTVKIDYDDLQHTYTVAHKLHDGTFGGSRPTHGITAPLIVISKPFLQPWAAKESAHAILEYLQDNPDTVYTLPEYFEDFKNYSENIKDPTTGKAIMTYYRFNKKWGWVKDAKAAYKSKSGEGKELGTWLHESIENYYNSDRTVLPYITPDCQGMWESFLEFDNYYKPQHDGLEFFVYSLLYGYSGQGDFRGVINGKYCIGDWKSTNRSDWNKDGIDYEYFLQVGGLAQAEFERTGKWPDDLFIANFDKKGEEPRVIFASELGMSPQDCAKAYLSCFNTYHTLLNVERKFKGR